MYLFSRGKTAHVPTGFLCALRKSTLSYLARNSFAKPRCIEKSPDTAWPSEIWWGQLNRSPLYSTNILPARCTFVLGLHGCFNWQGVSESAKFQLGIRASNISMLKVQGSMCGDYNIGSGEKRLDVNHIRSLSIISIWRWLWWSWWHYHDMSMVVILMILDTDSPKSRVWGSLEVCNSI